MPKWAHKEATASRKLVRMERTCTSGGMSVFSFSQRHLGQVLLLQGRCLQHIIFRAIAESKACTTKEACGMASARYSSGKI